MVTEVACSVIQFKVLLCPAVRLVGFAVKVMVGGSWFTVTVTGFDCAVPPGPVALATNVVVCAGLIDCEPEIGNSSPASPISGDRVTPVALVVCQLKVVDSPELILIGETLKVMVGGAALTATMTEVFASPAAFEAVKV